MQETRPQPKNGHPWLHWIQQAYAIAQWGLTYSKNVYDLERYEALRQLSVAAMADFAQMDKNRVLELFAHETGYVTPKVDVRGVVFREGKLLMVQEHWDGKWTVPGGWADIGLSPKEAVVKEIREESGFEAKPVKLLAVIDKRFHEHPPSPYHIYKIFIQCEITGGEARTSPESDDVAFFGPDEIPPLSLHRLTQAQVDLLFEHLRDPDRPTDYD